jgi:hypothetical protein
MKLKYKVLCGSSLATATHVSTKSTLDRAIAFSNQRAKAQQMQHWVVDGDSGIILWTTRKG